MKKYLIFFILILVSFLSWSQITSDFSLTVSPLVNIPIGPSLDNGTPYYSIGGGLSFKGEYLMPFSNFLFTQGVIDFDLVPINASENSVTFLSAGAGVGIRYSPISRFTLKASGYSGIYMGMVEAGSVRNPFIAASVDFSYLLNPSMNLGLGAVYKHNFTPDGAVYQGLGITLGVTFNIGAGSKGADLYVEPLINPIFPLFYSYYDKNPVGEVAIVNNERGSIENVRLSFLVKQYMDQAKVFAELDSIEQGQSLSIPVYALFTDNIFGITEGTKVAGEIIVDYSYIGQEMTSSYPVTVTINNRNAMSWDDDRKAAAFVTSKDPLVLSFAKNIAGSLRSDEVRAVNSNFRTAMAIFEGLTVYGIGYVIDPSTPYSVLSEDTESIDFVQFPNQTLAYKAGDCDDITILYSALLESVGIETAFVTAPGHIFMAFNLGMKPDSAAKLFAGTDDLILTEDETWIPIEITLVRDGFLKAWQIGAKEWRETNKDGTSGFFNVRKAWEFYEPVGFVQGAVAVMLPDSEKVISQYKIALNKFINREIGPRVDAIKEEMRKSRNNPRYNNKLGVLYAQFGLFDKAAAEFRTVIRSKEYIPALVNLGNIYYLRENMPEALSYYNRALDVEPGNTKALLGVARASYEVNDYDTVNSSLAKLENESPAMAARFSYLGSGSTDTGRASQALVKEVSEWDEEEEE